jgi:hypothetical protein
MALLQFVNSAGEMLEQGDVVVIAPRQADIRDQMGIPSLEVDVAQQDCDTAVCGIVQDLYAEHKPEPGQETRADRKERASGRGRGHTRTGPIQAYTLDELEALDRSKIAPGQTGHLVAGGLCRACKVDADIAPIKVGDLLTTSATKGHAQKVTDATKAAGAVLGKALAPLKKGKGTIAVLVTLQ